MANSSQAVGTSPENNFLFGQPLCCLTFPQHRAVVEATHPKNAPFGYLEAGQCKKQPCHHRPDQEAFAHLFLRKNKKDRSKKTKKNTYTQLRIWTLASITSAVVVGFLCPPPCWASPFPCEHEQPEHFPSGPHRGRWWTHG